MEHLLPNYFTNQVAPCEMNLITQKVVKFISHRFSGNYCIVDTDKKHTAINASREDRIHLIGNLK